MQCDIDPRLLAQIEEAGDDGEVEVLLLLAGDAESVAGEGEPGARLLDRVQAQVKQRPSEVRVMPRLGAMYVKGSVRLVRRLLEQDQVIAASANEGEVTPARGPRKRSR
jgi:hypothetical protein